MCVELFLQVVLIYSCNDRKSRKQNCILTRMLMFLEFIHSYRKLRRLQLLIKYNVTYNFLVEKLILFNYLLHCNIFFRQIADDVIKYIFFFLIEYYSLKNIKIKNLLYLSFYNYVFRYLVDKNYYIL